MYPGCPYSNGWSRSLRSAFADIVINQVWDAGVGLLLAPFRPLGANQQWLLIRPVFPSLNKEASHLCRRLPPDCQPQTLWGTIRPPRPQTPAPSTMSGAIPPLGALQLTQRAVLRASSSFRAAAPSGEAPSLTQPRSRLRVAPPTSRRLIPHSIPLE